jgi:hypothetical protein
MTHASSPVSLALAISAVASMGCQITVGNHEAGTETRTVSSFDSVEVDNGVEVDIDIDPAQSGDVELEVSGETNLIDLIETDIVGGSLMVDVDGPVSAHLPLEVKATVADLDYAGADNGALVVVDGVDRDAFDVNTNNGAEVRVAGTVAELYLTADNGADANTRELSADVVDVDVDNGASATVCANVEVTGIVNNGATLVVICGGDTGGVTTKNGGSVD